MKNLIILFCLISFSSFAQIQSVDYLMSYNPDNNQYEVYVEIVEGETTLPEHRNQYNSQVSIVVPTGRSLTLNETFMPLQNNYNYTGTVPAKWYITNQLNAPISDPTIDIYHTFLTLSPSSFYNDLTAGDRVHLFNFTVGTTGDFVEGVRFFDNDSDPSSLDPGMRGADFSNYFKIGGCENVFNNSSEEFNPTETIETFANHSVLFPNPFQNEINIKTSDDVRRVFITDATGKIVHSSIPPSTNNLYISTELYTKGVYIVTLELISGEKVSQKVIRI